VNGVPIRLTHERWFHITENHDDLSGYYYDVLETVEITREVVRGIKGTLKAVRNMGKNKLVGCGLQEIRRHDGFIITAYFLEKKPKGSNCMATATHR
jgi:hypothetical protein